MRVTRQSIRPASDHLCAEIFRILCQKTIGVNMHFLRGAVIFSSWISLATKTRSSMQVKSCDILMYFVDVTHVSILESADMSQLRQLYYTLPNCFCPDPFVTPEGYEKNGTVWQCAKGLCWRCGIALPGAGLLDAWGLLKVTIFVCGDSKSLQLYWKRFNHWSCVLRSRTVWAVTEKINTWIFDIGSISILDPKFPSKISAPIR